MWELRSDRSQWSKGRKRSAYFVSLARTPSGCFLHRTVPPRLIYELTLDGKVPGVLVTMARFRSVWLDSRDSVPVRERSFRSRIVKLAGFDKARRARGIVFQSDLVTAGKPFNNHLTSFQDPTGTPVHTSQSSSNSFARLQMRSSTHRRCSSS